MPTRLIREGILSSDRVNALDDPGELFYRRLLNVVDDYGRFVAKPALLRSSCYPLRTERLTDGDIQQHLKACAAVGLVRLYEGSDGKHYLQVRDFRQQVRAKYSRFPDPPPEPFDPDQLLSTSYATATQMLSTSEASAKPTEQALNTPTERRPPPPPPPKPEPEPVPPPGAAPEPFPAPPPGAAPSRPSPSRRPRFSSRAQKSQRQVRSPSRPSCPWPPWWKTDSPTDIAADWVTHRKSGARR